MTDTLPLVTHILFNPYNNPEKYVFIPNVKQETRGQEGKKDWPGWLTGSWPSKLVPLNSVIVTC